MSNDADETPTAPSNGIARVFPPVSSAKGGSVPSKTQALLEHEFEDESGLEYGGTAFGDFRTYMAAKQTKLQNQAKVALQANDEDVIPVFKGCVMYINGYTGQYSSEQLQRLIIKHGGVHVNHMWGGKTTVTHIIASNLTSRKREQLSQYRVVKPEWLTKCVEAGRLLGWQEYRTIETTPGQATLNMVSPVVKESDKSMPPPRHEQPDGVPPITDPGFIKHFYENSRLHHLSMWKADLRKKYLNVAQTRSTQKGSQEHTSSFSNMPRVIMHVDYDSFFVAVSLLKHPDLKDKPVCVASGLHDSSDIASVNYVARQKFGLSNGMWLKKARQMCPQLTILKFDFPAYEAASEHLYNALLELDPDTLYPVSVDEAVVDVTSRVYSLLPKGEQSTEEEVAHMAQEQVAAQLRNKIRANAGIEASVGIGNNMLLARVALAKAKPAGHLFIRWSERLSILDDGTISLRNLPGVGRSVVHRLNHELQVYTLADLREKVTQDRLEAVFGPKSGKRLWEVARGIDDTSIEESVAGALDRKSIGVEISWGVRASTREEVNKFICNLCHEISERMTRECVEGFVGRTITVKVYRAQKDAIASRSKVMGHGMCDIYSKSKNVPNQFAPTNDEEVLSSVSISLMDTMKCPPEAFRGIGIQVTKLEKKGQAKQKTDNRTIFDFMDVANDVQEEPRTPQKPKPQPQQQHPDLGDFDWDVYNGLPTTLKRIVKEEYSLPSTPGPAAGSTTNTSPSKAADGVTRSPSKSPSKKGLVRSPSKSPSKRKGPFAPPPVASNKRLRGAGQNTLTQQFGVGPSNRIVLLNNGGGDASGDDVRSSQNYFARPDIIDADVLKELPASVVADLQRELQARSTTGPSSRFAKDPFASAPAAANGGAAPEKTVRLGSGLAPFHPVLLDDRLAHLETQVYPALTCWVHTTSSVGGPHPEDVETVRRYVAGLAGDPAYWVLARKVVCWVKREARYATTGRLHQRRNGTKGNGGLEERERACLENAEREWKEVVGLLQATLVNEFALQGVPV